MDSIINTIEYKEWLTQIKSQYRQRQIKAAVKVNTELVSFYWDLGRAIVERQKNANWGDGLIEQLSRDMRDEFPDTGGFSVANINFCKRFYLFYNQEVTIRYQLGSELQNLLFSIPWRHHIEIMTKCKEINEAVFYLSKTIENGWSRSVLIHCIEQKLYSTQGKAVSNFEQTLPPAQSDLAKQALKDPYIFNFLSMSEKYKEKELEKALTDNIIHFVMELGSGFAFVGRQYPIEVDGESFRIDLLFYHLSLRCYIVIELKTCKFKPEFAGQVGFYIAAIDNDVRHPTDNQTIGLIICKSKNEVVVRYALQNIKQPIGVSEYQLLRQLPDKLQNTLPTIEEIENELNEL